MKTVRLGPDAVFYRFLTPKWAYVPLSGAGAAIDGVRFNRPGMEALYLSDTPQTALEEYRQGASIAPPATLAGYRITLERVADLSKGHDPAVWKKNWKAWNCSWRKIARLEKRVPPSWLLADELVTDGIQGLLFPSLQNNVGNNLVVFNANLGSEDAIEVHDPDKRLPVDQTSWPGP